MRRLLLFFMVPLMACSGPVERTTPDETFTRGAAAAAVLQVERTIEAESKLLGKGPRREDWIGRSFIRDLTAARRFSLASSQGWALSYAAWVEAGLPPRAPKEELAAYTEALQTWEKAAGEWSSTLLYCDGYTYRSCRRANGQVWQTWVRADRTLEAKWAALKLKFDR